MYEQTGRSATWMDRRGTPTTYARQESDALTGERVEVVRWDDDGTVHVIHITGDGRFDGHVIHDEQTLAADADVREYAAGRLGVGR